MQYHPLLTSLSDTKLWPQVIPVMRTLTFHNVPYGEAVGKVYPMHLNFFNMYVCI